MSLRLSRRENIWGPMSEIVARTGWPFSPKTSKKTTGLACGEKSVSFKRIDTLFDFSVERSGQRRFPARSPFTSARNTGTPMLENCSASFCSVTVFPVPVAPVMRPWRLAISGNNVSKQGSFWVAGFCNDKRIKHGWLL